MPKLRYDYYTVNIPADCEEEPGRRFDMACDEARERARIYAMPCQWRKLSDDGENVRVRRLRYAKS